MLLSYLGYVSIGCLSEDEFILPLDQVYDIDYPYGNQEIDNVSFVDLDSNFYM